MKQMTDYVGEWESNATKDPYWAILTSEEGKNRGWDPEQFFATGKQEIDRLWTYMEEQGLRLEGQLSALDFGCGVGRVTRALKGHFQEVVGVDLSSHMIEEAKRNNPSLPFLHNPKEDLQLIPSHSMDFIYAHIVLQHIPPHFQKNYLKEFARILKKGGMAVIQIPSEKRGVRDQLRAFILARLPIGFKSLLKKVLKKKEGYESGFYIEMHCMSEKEVIACASEGLLELQHFTYTNSTDPYFAGRLEFFSKKEASKRIGLSPYISCLYFFQKK